MRKAFVLFTVALSTLITLFGAITVDSNSSIPYYLMIIGLAWNSLFVYANRKIFLKDVLTIEE